MPEDGFAPMGGQSAEDAPTSMTMEDFTETVSGSVSGSISPRLDALEERLDGVAGRLQIEGLSERVDALSARMEEARLQAGELVTMEEIGPAVIDLIGQLLDALDSDGDGASDVASMVSEIRAEVRDISGALVHPAMTTDFADYTVLEAVLLLLLVWKFIAFWLSSLKEAFSWLR